MEIPYFQLVGFFAMLGLGGLTFLFAVGKAMYGRCKGIERHQVEAQYFALGAIVLMVSSILFLK